MRIPKYYLEAFKNPNIPTKIRIKKIKVKCPLESSEGKMFWEWAQYHPIAKQRLYHIPNGGSRNKIEAKNLKAQGVKSGVSDYFLSYPHNGKPGLYIELKRRDRGVCSLTEEQAQWLAASERLGYATKVVYGADEAIKAVEDYLK
jgi:hypothetical protein